MQIKHSAITSLAHTHPNTRLDMPAKKWGNESEASTHMLFQKHTTICLPCCAFLVRCAWNHCDNNAHWHRHTLTHTHTGMSRCVAVLTCGKEQTKRTTAAVQKQQQDQNETAKEKKMKKKKKLAKNMFKTFSSTLHLRCQSCRATPPSPCPP